MNPDLFDQGLKTRREVLGADYVDAAIANADDFNRPLQEMVTQYAWGDVWNRPGLSRRDRSLLNLAMLTALNRPHELKLHVRGALTNGVSKDRNREVFLQTAIYCGVPAAIDSFRSARRCSRTWACDERHRRRRLTHHQRATTVASAWPAA